MCIRDRYQRRVHGEKMRQEFFHKFQRTHPVNPLMVLLYVQMTFKSWTKYTKDRIEKEKLAREKGYEYVSDEVKTESEDEDVDDTKNGQQKPRHDGESSFHTRKSSELRSSELRSNDILADSSRVNSSFYSGSSSYR
eukprot:TRINITY_DN8444_c0_g1_i10.p1 TRINITY_DN8444_c0_g1~~TRINITY_DN8444_c0_g1_i10.p1  ORF type:complete len:137 (-),score=31.36 TRINITY_DN8444_c0_g1_i10:203-613(-)